MPNWCYTDYRICGNKGQLVELKEKLDYLKSLSEPYAENGFGKLWCGCLVQLLGGDWNEVYCRGEICEYGFSGCTLNLTVMSAWSELGEWRHFIESKFSKIEIYYRAEEPGNCYYETNDVDGSYFPDRYLIDTYDGPEYFTSLENAAKWVSELVGKEVKAEEDEIEKELDKYEAAEWKAGNNDAFYSFHSYFINEN